MMTLPLLSVHATDTYPVVRFLPEAAVPGYAALWVADMEQLIAADVPFAVLYPEGLREETHEDRKSRGLWLKAQRDVLARHCLALVCVEPDADKRQALQAQLNGFAKAFGVPQQVAATQADALTLARAYLAGLPA